MADVVLNENEVIEDMGFGLQIVQNLELYRFTSDSVLLSRFALPKKNDIVADFCEDICRNIRSLRVVTSCNAVEHRNERATERICRNSHN